eukprot:1658935-Lingulodinium_polyedra.AAC.1
MPQIVAIACAVCLVDERNGGVLECKAEKLRAFLPTRPRHGNEVGISVGRPPVPPWAVPPAQH